MTAPRRRGTRRFSDTPSTARPARLLRRPRGSSDSGTRVDRSWLRKSRPGLPPRSDPARAICRQGFSWVFPGSWRPLLTRTPRGGFYSPSRTLRIRDRRPDANEDSKSKKDNGLRPAEIDGPARPVATRHEQRRVLPVVVQAAKPPVDILGLAQRPASGTEDRPPPALRPTPSTRCRRRGSGNRYRQGRST